MKSEDANNWASVVQSVVIALSVPIAGYWTYSTFDATRQAQVAEAKYEQLRREIRDTRSIEITLHPDIASTPQEPTIVTTIRLKNAGSQRETFELRECTLSAYIARFGGASQTHTSGSNPTLRQLSPLILTLPGGEFEVVALDPGEEITLVSLVSAPQPGLYLFEFKVPAQLGTDDSESTTSIYSEIAYVAMPGGMVGE